MPQAFTVALAIMLSFSVGGSIMVIVDKYNAIHRLYRISEATLLFFSAMGGALLMFLTMKLVHHKTKKAKFMLTLPLLAAVHIVLLFALYR